MSSLCRSCGAKILWIELKSGKKMPVDPELVSADDCEVGDTLVTEEGFTFKIGPAVAHGEGCEAMEGYVSHFASCPQADNWRKKK